MATAKGSLSVGGSRNEALTTAGEQDTFTVALVAGYNYQFYLTPAASFTTNPGYLYETLVGPNGITVSNSQLSAGSNGSANSYSRSLSITPTTSGTYTLSVANAANATGTYTLAATPQDDIGPTPVQLAIGGSTTNTLESAGDVDTFTVALVAGYNYQFTLTPTASFTTSPQYTYETLIGPNGLTVTNSQLSAGSNTSRSISITPTAATAGTYTLSVKNTANATSTYKISVSTSSMNAVYRFFDNTNGTHFFTADVNERNSILANLSSRYTEETNGFGDVSAADPNATAVYRFFDTAYGTHFFTASASERDTILATRADLTYEPGSTFYEHAAQQAGDVAVYRFFDTQYGTHFYTGNASEFTGLTTPGSPSYRSNLTYEGVGFYAPAGTFS